MGIDQESLWQLALLAIMLVLGWVVVRFIFKLTTALFRIGCAIIATIIAFAFLITVLVV